MAKKRSKKAPTAKVLEARGRARRDGWLKWIRQGQGEEADERAMRNGCWFDQRRADHWLEFADEYGTLTEGAWAGQPFRLLDWQATATGRLFGWQKHHDEWGYAVRRFRYFYEEVPKKNGKTPLASLLGNYLLFGDSYGRQINITTAATTRKQAERLLKHAVRQIENHPDLADAAKVRKLEGFLHVTHEKNEWQVVAADPDSADGVNGHCIADEIHRWVGFEFYNTLRWMLASQPEGLFIAITTAGSQMESVCRTLHEKTKAVNSGRQFDDDFLGEIWAADPKDDPHDEKTWRKANPSLGNTAAHPLKMSSFRADYQSARDDPTQWPAWLQLRLNLWRTNIDSWIDKATPNGLADWDAGEGGRKGQKKRVDCYEPFTMNDLCDVPCWMGFDGATVRDTTAAVFAFPWDQGRTVRVLPFFWLPQNTAEREQKRTSYRQWAERMHDGWPTIKLTPGDAVDFRTVFEDLRALFSLFNVQRFYFDPMFQAEWLTQELESETGVERVEFPQTITHYAPVVRLAETMIIEHTLRHNGHPVLTWQVANARAKSNANGDKRLIKPLEGDHRKVDGAQAMLMAIRDAVANDQDRDFYDDNEVEVV